MILLLLIIGWYRLIRELMWTIVYVSWKQLPRVCTEMILKSIVVPYSITSVGHGADPGFLAVSTQVTLVINPVVGCRYFPPGPWLLC